MGERASERERERGREGERERERERESERPSDFSVAVFNKAGNKILTRSRGGGVVSQEGVRQKETNKGTQGSYIFLSLVGAAPNAFVHEDWKHRGSRW